MKCSSANALSPSSAQHVAPFLFRGKFIECKLVLNYPMAKYLSGLLKKLEKICKAPGSGYCTTELETHQCNTEYRTSKVPPACCINTGWEFVVEQDLFHKKKLTKINGQIPSVLSSLSESV